MVFDLAETLTEGLLAIFYLETFGHVSAGSETRVEQSAAFAMTENSPLDTYSLRSKI
jgi:hypothetical protein